MAIRNNEHGGRRENQKFKSMLVAQVLLKRTDEEHAMKTKDIKDFLEAYGISSEVHSIQRDIRLLNQLFEIDTDPEIEVEERERLNYYIEYDKSKHGYKVVNRPYDFDELKLLAECIHTAKFISEKQSKDLLETVYSLCSEHQAKEIQKKVYLVGRTSGKTRNERMMRSIQRINEAIKEDCQIEFQYMKYTIQDRANQVSRRNGATYRYSPFALLINDGNYYMLAADMNGKRLYHFRVDRMKGVSKIQEERTGKDLLQNFNIVSVHYTSEHSLFFFHFLIVEFNMICYVSSRFVACSFFVATLYFRAILPIQLSTQAIPSIKFYHHSNYFRRRLDCFVFNIFIFFFINNYNLVFNGLL